MLFSVALDNGMLGIEFTFDLAQFSGKSFLFPLWTSSACERRWCRFRN